MNQRRCCAYESGAGPERSRRGIRLANGSSLRLNPAEVSILSRRAWRSRERFRPGRALLRLSSMLGQGAQAGLPGSSGLEDSGERAWRTSRRYSIVSSSDLSRASAWRLWNASAYLAWISRQALPYSTPSLVCSRWYLREATLDRSTVSSPDAAAFSSWV